MKPNDHKQLTRIALGLFDHYAPGGLGNGATEIRGKIVSGAVAEDNPSLDRIRNWHFFRENDHITDITVGPLVLMHRTSERILQKKIVMLEAVLKKQGRSSEKVYFLLGGILHHVQDMSTPAHAVPVYHDPIIKDSFEEYSEKELDRPEVRNRLATPAENYKAVMGEPEPKDAVKIYQTSARRTLKTIFAMTPPFTINGRPAVESRLWTYFWRTYDPAAGKPGGGADPPGFGHYGPLGKCFGKTEISLGRDVYAVDPAVYSEFHADVAGKTIRDSLRVLRWFEAKIAR